MKLQFIDIQETKTGRRSHFSLGGNHSAPGALWVSGGLAHGAEFKPASELDRRKLAEHYAGPELAALRGALERMTGEFLTLIAFVPGEKEFSDRRAAAFHECLNQARAAIGKHDAPSAETMRAALELITECGNRRPLELGDLAKIKAIAARALCGTWPGVAEKFPHDVCPKCRAASVPAEAVPDQALRGCRECGNVWTENLNQPAAA